MHRKQLQTLLDNYQPFDADECFFKEEMFRFLNAHEDCFERSCKPGHFTASSWLLDKTGTKALLMHHAKLNRWVQLGGHCDGDPDVLAVSLKEAQEESGIQNIVSVCKTIFDIDIHMIPENKVDPEHYHYDVRFLLQVVSDEEPVQNRESKALRWFGKEQENFPTQARSVFRMFEKWRSGKA